MLDKRKVVIIGAGHVGSHVAMALCFQGTCDEIAFIDIDREKAVANCYDVADACLFLPIDFKGIFVSITNPADVIANYARVHLGLPRERCFSTGTSLDTARLKRTVSELANIDRKSVTTCAIGEHGDSSFVPFSTLTLGGKNYKELQEAKPEKYSKLTEDFVLERTRYIGYDIINGKGSTEFGIGAACADICKAIFHDEKRVIPASVLLEGEYGIDGVACGVPCVIGRNGIEDIIELELNDKEKEQMAHTCSVIKDYCERAEKVQ